MKNHEIEPKIEDASRHLDKKEAENIAQKIDPEKIKTDVHPEFFTVFTKSGKTVNVPKCDFVPHKNNSGGFNKIKIEEKLRRVLEE